MVIKKILWFAAILIVGVGMLNSTTQYKSTNTLYVRAVVITDKQWDTYTGTDTQGNDWIFSNTNDWSIVDTIYLIMDTQSIEDITDDIIITESRAE